MTDVQVAIGLRRKARNDGRNSCASPIASALIAAARQIGIDDLAQKVGWLCGRSRRFRGFAIKGHAPIVEKKMHLPRKTKPAG